MFYLFDFDFDFDRVLPVLLAREGGAARRLWDTRVRLLPREPFFPALAPLRNRAGTTWALCPAGRMASSAR